MIVSPPKPRTLEKDMSDLLDHCVTIGNEI